MSTEAAVPYLLMAVAVAGRAELALPSLSLYVAAYGPRTWVPSQPLVSARVGELSAAVGKPAAEVSQHLAQLRRTRLVRTRRQGISTLVPATSDTGTGRP